ncbi:hypothetical protein DdX_18687 [Ditylenchus destructor]|uniref:Uncharacterized protein n=1 Tax=Ditylenchus destructor TaxID=166010 RepID=A0AAD4MJ81_9BILA|nr:hypothetical protein DdX_18687 [Ditylenchus destructor]
MVSYMAVNAVGRAVSIPMYAYPLCNIRGPIWTGTLGFAHMAIEPLTVFFLALDRCLTIQFMTKIKTENVVFICNIICNTACTLSIVLPASVIYFVQLPASTINAISFYKSMYIFSLKMTVGVLNACACAFLCWKVRTSKRKT